MIEEATGLLHYRIAKDAIGKYISFECTPVRDDGTVGEPKVHLSTDPVRPGTKPPFLKREIGTKRKDCHFLIQIVGRLYAETIGANFSIYEMVGVEFNMNVFALASLPKQI